jgi:hypothetical protein
VLPLLPDWGCVGESLPGEPDGDDGSSDWLPPELLDCCGGNGDSLPLEPLDSWGGNGDCWPPELPEEGLEGGDPPPPDDPDDPDDPDEPDDGDCGPEGELLLCDEVVRHPASADAARTGHSRINFERWLILASSGNELVGNLAWAL